MNKIKKNTIIFTIPLILSLFFILSDLESRKLTGDASIYYTVAKNLSTGIGFSHSPSPPYLPTMSREPVYPFFLSLIIYLFNDNIFTLQVAQAIIHAFTCVILSKIFFIIVQDKKLSFFTSLIVASYPTIASYTPHLITEVLFTFLLALSMLVLIKSFDNDNLKLFFLSGIFMGIATLCRAILMLFFLFIIPAIIFYYYQEYKKIIIPIAIKASFLLLTGYTLIVMPWMLRNYTQLNKFAITLRGHSTMYTRAVKVNLNINQLKMYAIYSFSEFLAGKLYPKYNLTSTGEGFFYQPVENKNEKYSAMGLSQEESDSMFKKETRTLIQKHPVRFITMGLFEIIKFNSFNQILLLNTKDFKEKINNTILLPVLRGIYKILGFFIFGYAIIGVVRTRSEWRTWVVLFTIIIYFNAVHFFLDSVGRYALPIIPYYLFFSILGIKKTIDIFLTPKPA